MPRLSTLILLIALSLYPLSALYGRLLVLGLFRPHPVTRSSFPISEKRTIHSIQQAEDFAYHQPSGYIFFTAQGNTGSRYGWWPPVGTMGRPEDADSADGGIWALDTQTWEARRIPMNLKGPFITHGMDIYSPPDQPDTIYLHAINHLPSTIHHGRPNSTIEIFRIHLPSLTASHTRTLSHDLIHTPNDIYSLGPEELYFTNDHVNIDGPLRSAEDLLTLRIASRTNLVHIRSEGKGMEAKVVLKGLHSANGLAKGPGGGMILNDAAGGIMSTYSPDLERLSSVGFDTSIDNPTYYSDPDATPRSNSSAYVLAGLLQAGKLHDHVNDPDALIPSIIWLARRKASGKWEKKVLLEDDGSWLHSATTAMLLPVPDKQGLGKKEAWVVATGLMAKGVVVAKVDLTDWAVGYDAT